MPVTLTLILSGRVRLRFEFEAAERLRIGRSEDCEVFIDNLGVSRYHTEITRRDGCFYVLRDLQSNNGTFVNGSRVETHNLNNGDIITVGKYSVEFKSVSPEESGEEGGAPGSGAGDDVPEAPEGAMTLQVDASSLARLAGASKTTRIRGFLAMRTGRARNMLLEKPVYLIGADPDADLRLTGWFSPRVAALILRDEAGFRLLDVSPRGTAVRVNGKQRRDSRLSDNDEVRIDGVTAQFNRGAPGADSA
jgi:pSer/pThr/pTyr-binding forkhead associated (FHA) protein